MVVADAPVAAAAVVVVVVVAVAAVVVVVVVVAVAAVVVVAAVAAADAVAGKLNEFVFEFQVDFKNRKRFYQPRIRTNNVSSAADFKVADYFRSLSKCGFNWQQAKHSTWVCFAAS